MRARDGAKDDGATAGTGGRNAERDFHDIRWSNETHRSTTDNDARHFRKGRGREAKLCYLDHALMENRPGLAIDGLISWVAGEAERLSVNVKEMGRPNLRRRIAHGAD